MLATLASFFDPWEAHVVRARLDSEGVPATVAFANHAIVDWPLSLALGGTLVQVPEKYLIQSQKILFDYHAGFLEDELNDVSGTERDHCPRCGSTNFKRSMRPHRRIYAIFIVFFVAAFPARQDRLICKACDFNWDWGVG